MKTTILHLSSSSAACMGKTALAVLALAITAASIPFATATLLVTEPFDYTPGTYPAGNWTALNSNVSGIGWAAKGYSDHTTNSCNFVIGSGGPVGGYFESQGQTNFGSYFRDRSMKPPIHNNLTGTVTWQSMLMWSNGSNNGGGMIVHGSTGGTNYNIRLTSEDTYELRGGHNNSQGTTDQDVSTHTVSTNSNTPDLLLFKIENTAGAGLQTVRLWINPDVTLGETGLPAPDLSVSYRAFTDNRNLGGILLSPGAVKFDEILFGTEYKDVISAIPPIPPYAPVPADSSIDVSVTKTLRWSNADADSYQVFFWKSSTAKPVTPIATTTAPLYDPPSNLELNTAYSWQVIVIKGGVQAAGPTWTFQTGGPFPPGVTSTPIPSDTATELVTSTVLRWGEASRATSYDVFLWPDDNARPTNPTANVEVENYSPSAPLAYGTTYHWQVEAVNEFGRNTESPVWSFTTQLLVNTPAPSNNSTNMLVWKPLGWAASPGVASYDVFLWKNGSTKPQIAIGNTITNQYFPAVYLDFGAAYHWQVVAQLTAGGTVTGPEWSFTTETNGQTVATPPFDISPSAQAARIPLYDTHGRDRLTAADTPLSAGMKISFYGDSITWLDGYLGQIRSALSASPNTSSLDTTLINHGVNGGGIKTIRDGDTSTTNHFGGTVPQPFATTIASEHPDVVVLFIGINDIWLLGTSPADFEQALRDITAQASAGGVSHFVIATPWLHGEKSDGSNGDDAKIIAFSALCRQVATDTGATFVDLHTLAMAYLQNNNFTLEDDGTLSYLVNGRLTYDGVHPTGAGNNLLADQLSLAVHDVLAGPTNDAPIKVRENTTDLTDGSAIPVSFGTIPVGTPVSKTFTITNDGMTDLTLGGISKDGTDANAFIVTAPSSNLLSAGSSTTFTVTFAPPIAGVKTAAIHLANDAPGDLNPFDVSLTGTALSFNNDTDGDGMSDAAEFNLAAMGFDWQVSQVARVNALFTGANSAGLYQDSQVHALQVATPRLDRNSTNGQFKLTLAVSKSNDMSHFTPLPMTVPQTTLNAEGELEFTFDSIENAAFFRIETK